MRDDPAPPIGEDDLHAHLDGQLDPARAAAVAAWLAARPGEAARMRELAAQRDALRAALAFKAAEPIPARLRLAHIRAARRRAWQARGRVAAAAACLMLAGAGLGWSVRGALAPAPAATELPALASAPAMLHHLLAGPSQVTEVAARGADLAAWLDERLEAPLPLPDLAAFGFAPNGALLLAGAEGQAALLRYRHAEGGGLSVWRRPADDPEPRAMRCTDEPGDLVTYSWSDGRHLFAVTAALPRDRLRPIALAVERAMRAPPPGTLIAGPLRRPCLAALG